MPSDRIAQQLFNDQLELIINHDDDKRRFSFEIECVQDNWSFHEMKLPVSSLYFEWPDTFRDK